MHIHGYQSTMWLKNKRTVEFLNNFLWSQMVRHRELTHSKVEERKCGIRLSSMFFLGFGERHKNAHLHGVR